MIAEYVRKSGPTGNGNPSNKSRICDNPSAPRVAGLRKYIYAPGIDQPVSMIEVADANAVYYYHFDALGSVVALSDAAGDTVQTYEYSVCGEVAAQGPNHPNPYMFAGVLYDIEIGLYYNRARYYNPFTGRFLQTDPVGYKDGMNMYRYCKNSPLSLRDPSGLWSLEGHRALGEYGGGGPNDLFDYGRLDIDYPSTDGYIDPHFRDDVNEIIEEAIEAAKSGDVAAFEYHVHEAQDWYSHEGAGIGWIEHIFRRHAPDDPNRPENRDRYESAHEITIYMEALWFLYTGDDPDEEGLAKEYDSRRSDPWNPSSYTPPHREWWVP